MFRLFIRIIKLQKWLIFMSLITLFLYFLYLNNNSKIVDFERISQISHRIYEIKNKSLSDENVCILPKLDPWDDEVQQVFPNPGSTPRECVPSITILTSLNNGVLKTNWRFSLLSWFPPNCYYRCLHVIDDYSMKQDEWARIDNKKGVIPGCEIVEVRCYKWFWFHYRFMHVQIIEKPENTFPLSNKIDYNFYWLLIDSTSASMFKRAMRETRKVIMDEMKAVEFPYLNKIPWNSRPNAYALFLNEQSFRINSNIAEDYETGKDINHLCRTVMDELKFIGFDFRDAGYRYDLRTMMTEDWALDWPDCIGFKKPPVHHYFRPFWMKLDSTVHVDRLLLVQMYFQSCKLGHSYDLDHLSKFIDAYPGKPKFSITWVTQLAHDDNFRLFTVDTEFAQFFKQLNEKAKNSFIFFQSDHGKRQGDVREIPILGELEDNNPFLYIIVPENLRNNTSLMNRLRNNSQNLISPFDLYASALDIAKSAHEWDSKTSFNEPAKPVNDRKLIGSSIFRPMKQPRTCTNIHIPWDFCICYVKSVDLNDPALAIRVAGLIIDSINTQLDESKHSKECLRHSLSQNYPIRLEKFMQKESEGRMLKVKFETLPGKALYQGVAKLNPDNSITLMQKDFARGNRYAEQSYCIPESFIRNYCICPDKV